MIEKVCVASNKRSSDYDNLVHWFSGGFFFKKMVMPPVMVLKGSKNTQHLPILYPQECTSTQPSNHNIWQTELNKFRFYGRNF